MTDKKIRVKLVGDDAHTAYIALPGYRNEKGIVAKSVRLDGVIADYKGPMVVLDFNKEGVLIGIEVLTFGS